MSYDNRNYKDCTLTDELQTRDNNWTPDYLELKAKKLIPLFIYGTMKIGAPNFTYLKDSIYLGEGKTSTQGYVMERDNECDVPVVFGLDRPQAVGHYVMGDVFLVTPKDMLNIDYCQMNNKCFRRTERHVYLPDQALPTKNKLLRPAIKAWIYLGIPSYWDDIETSTMRSIELPLGQRAYEWTPKVQTTENLLDKVDIPRWNPALMEKYQETSFSQGPLLI